MRLWLRLREQARLEAALPVWLPEFLPRQRWFGGKGRTIVAARLEDAVWLETEEPTALVVAAVDYGGATSERFGMLLALRRTPGALPLIGRLEAPEEDIAVVEAASGEASMRALLKGFDPPAALPTLRGGKLRYGDVDPGDSRTLGRALAAPIRNLGVEQSNTAVAVGTSHLFKLFRKLESGENPELEVVRFLTTCTGFRALPALRGSLNWEPASGPHATLGLLQDWIANRGDGWNHVLARLREIGAGTTDAETLARDVGVLGAVTRELHDALASETSDPAFAPEPVTMADVEGWTGSLRDHGHRVRGLLAERLDALPEEARTVARALVDALADPEPAIRPPAIDGAGAFHKIRVHGDYHLGQTLKTEQGFVLIDFEGEPARPFAARRAKQCALKDAAGMLRSFDYALETVADAAGFIHSAPPRRPQRGMLASREAASLRPVETRLGPSLRAAFLDGYIDGVRGASDHYLPATQDAFRGWLGFFELDKALYEVEYELSHRPDWLAIPVRGALRILRSGASS